MFATLTIALPTTEKSTGGELIVSHRGQEHKFEMVSDRVVTRLLANCSAVFLQGDATDEWDAKANWVAFFTDCVHEVKPVKKGFRVALTYFVYRPKAESKRILSEAKLPLQPPVIDLMRQFRMKATMMLTEWRQHGLGWFCEHMYVEKSLDIKHLKGSDAALARALQAIFGPFLVDKLT